MTAQQKCRIFMSYSHKDESFKDDLEGCLKILSEHHPIKYWSDRDLIAGDDFEAEIMKKLSEADIVCMLISRDFLQSDFCRNKEMTAALKKYASDSGRVISIIIRETPGWNCFGIGKYTALPTDAKPLSVWDDPDQFWSDVYYGLEKAILHHLGIEKTEPAPTSEKDNQDTPAFIVPDGEFPRKPDNFTDRKDAISFFEATDDGLSPERLSEADIVLMGISRTGRTTIARRLANRGYKVANFPLAPDIQIPDTLRKVNPDKVFYLTNSLATIFERRKEREKPYPPGFRSKYANIETILHEIRYAEKIFAQEPAWITINQTGRDIDDIIEDITDRLSS